MTSTPTSPPSGWYPDVTKSGQVRYWDGTQWTSDVLPAQPPQSSPLQMHSTFAQVPGTPRPTAARTGLPTAGKIALAGGVAALIGAFLPWVSAISAFGNIDQTGFDAGDGKLSAGLAIAAMLLGYFGVVAEKKSTVIFAMIAAAGGFALVVYDWIDIQNRASEIDSEFVKASVGVGIYVSAVGFLVCFFQLLGCLRRRDGRWQDALKSS